MEEQWVVDRENLRAVWLEHLDWSQRQLAEEVGRSKSWVKKWLKRLRSRPWADREVLQGLSRVRKHLPAATAPEVVQKILELRDHPPRKLGRTPGPLTILYYLQQDVQLQQAGLRLPRSTRTVWKILDRHHRILRPGPREHEREERPEPGVEWGMDFHDVSTVPADPQGKQQHVVEILNLVDHGSSAVVASEPGTDYTAETALRQLAEILVEQGCPRRIRLDRDPRWVGSWTAKDFPSPLLRFLSCLGIEAQICPPQRPDKNPFVERYHRNYKYECQLRERPQDLNQTIATNQPYVHFYNYERPNQALTCGNLPPKVKFPDPPQLAAVPSIVDPDRWLLALSGKTYKRKLDYKGCFQLGNQTYYVQRRWSKKWADIWVDGQGRELVIYIDRQAVKQIPVKGLQNRMMDFPAYVELMCMEAASTWRRLRRRTPTYGRVTM